MLYPIVKEYYDRASTVVQKEPPTNHYHTHLIKASYAVTKEGGQLKGVIKMKDRKMAKLKESQQMREESEEGMKVCKKKAVCHWKNKK